MGVSRTSELPCSWKWLGRQTGSLSQAPQGRAMHGSENEAVPIKTPSLNFSIGCPGEHKNCRQQRAAKSKG